jgi:hypothetical protein
MASDGSRGPKPFRQVRHSTVFLRVPAYDWPAVKRGLKTEFRSGWGKNKTPKLFQVEPPTPVVAYTVQRGEYEARLMVLEAIWLEPLGAISPESLEREGFASLAEFRTYWLERERRRFTPTRQVFVYRVRPWVAGQDEAPMGEALLQRLYGEFLPEPGLRAAA